MPTQNRSGGGCGCILAILAIAVLAVGAGWYFAVEEKRDFIGAETIRTATGEFTEVRQQIITPRIETAGSEGRLNQAAMETRIHELVNDYRVAQGRTALQHDPALGNLARYHSAEMATTQHYGHVNMRGEDPTDRARKAGYDCGNPLSIGVAENIIHGWLYRSRTIGVAVTSYDWYEQESLANLLVDSWINSPGHRRNILDRRYGVSGVGVAFGNANDIYGTQNFC